MAEAQMVSDPNLTGRVQALLNKPFDEALKDCAVLREYINSSEDSAALTQEFRENWHAEAPLPLRQLLEELLDPEVARANVAATEALLLSRAQVLPLGEEAPASKPRRDGGQEDASGQGPEAEGMPPIDDEVDEFVQVNVSEAVDKLLALSFEEALRECKVPCSAGCSVCESAGLGEVVRQELRTYVQSPESVGERKALAAEFQSAWSPEAPLELRELLEELLFPEIAAKKAQSAPPLPPPSRL
ncbi:unnamed protein product [Effrenium voratum]|nr:unnamed protein product [Effrenium voratum]